MYLRSTFVPRRFYHAPTLDDSTWVYVLENNAADQLVVRRIDTSFAGDQQPRIHIHMGIRHLAVARLLEPQPSPTSPLPPLAWPLGPLASHCQDL